MDVRNPGPDDVFREKLEGHREDYIVEYQPADSRSPFAVISLTFLLRAEASSIVKFLEQEAHYWLRRYPVSAMAFPFDDTGALIRLPNGQTLVALSDSSVDTPIFHWYCPLKDPMEIPERSISDLAHIYHDVSFRRVIEIQKNVTQEARLRGRTMRSIVLLVIGVPLLVELISLGVDWLGHALAATSLSAGIWKLGVSMSWWKPTKKQREHDEKDLKMRHYYYHCERNPTAFARLRAENSELEAREATLRHAEKLRNRG